MKKFWAHAERRSPALAAFHRVEASARLQYAIASLDILLVILGLALVTVGMEVTDTLEHMLPRSPTTPRLWSVGFLPIILGLSGILVVLSRCGSCLILWTCCSVVASCASYIYFTTSGCFDVEALGVSDQIFTRCRSTRSGCVCQWGDSSAIRPHVSCDIIKRATVLYLTLVCLLVVSLVAIAAVCVLSAVRCCCLRLCAIEVAMSRDGLDSDAEQRLLAGANLSYCSQRHLTSRFERTDSRPTCEIGMGILI